MSYVTRGVSLRGVGQRCCWAPRTKIMADMKGSHMKLHRAIPLDRGFTLIELMITMLIAGVLAAITVPSYLSYVAKQKVRVGQSDLVSLAMNMENYLQNNTTYPAVTAGTSATQTALSGSGWGPAGTSDFSYAITAVVQPTSTSNGTYTVTATGTSNFVTGCTITLTSANVRTVSGCAGGGTTW